jgi:hypothetical protein
LEEGRRLTYWSLTYLCKGLSFNSKTPMLQKREPHRNFIFLEVYPIEFIMIICYAQVNVTAILIFLQIIVVQFFSLLS